MQLLELFSPLLPPCTSFAAIPIEHDAPLFADEQAAVARAVVKRRRGFVAGRACARRALGMDVPIGVGPHGAPLWPAGYAGSITHTDEHAAAVASCAIPAIGIDLEVLARAAAIPDLLAMITTAGDVIPEHAHAAAIVFSAKESAYKCLFPTGGRFLAFTDIDLAFCTGGTFEVLRATGYDANGVRGRFAVDRTHVATVAFVERPAHAPSPLARLVATV